MLVVDGGLVDMWGDSREDEDEQCVRAKRLLTRAEKRDREAMWIIAKGSG